jgi:hypothetical protein
VSDAPSSLVDVFEQQLRQRAELCGWLPMPNPQLLHEDGQTAVASLLAALQDSSTRASDMPAHLPPSRRALDLVPVSLSLLLCPLDAADPDDSYRAALWWTGLVRSEIPPSRRSDLHLFLIGPRGTIDDSVWRGRRSQMEADERFCRKFVWLPSDQPKPDEIATFFDRTFLAQPWVGASAEPRSLDPLEGLIREATDNTLLTALEVREWIARLGAADSTAGHQVAEDLVRVLEKRE